MRKRKLQEVPARLSKLERRFATWRKERVRGERIPKQLWSAAAKLAADYGVSQAATVLKVDYYSLKKHVDARVVGEGRDAAFFELPSAQVTHVNECVIEFANGTGASLRLHLKGTDIPDVLALGESFWSAE